MTSEFPPDIIPPGYMSLRSLPQSFKHDTITSSQSQILDFEDSWEHEMYLVMDRYDSKLWPFIRSLYKCGRFARTDCCPHHRIFGGECEEKKVTVTYCHARYCSHPGCIRHRYAQALNRLNSIRWYPVFMVTDWKVRLQLLKSKFSDPKLLQCEIRKARNQFFSIRRRSAGAFPRRVYHFAIGSIFLSKSGLDRAVRNFIRRMRSKGYRMHYIKVFDIGRSSFEETQLYWLHYHFALIPEFSSSDVPDFISDARAACDTSNSSLVFQNIGFRSKPSVFAYFSRRIAGVLGHKDPGYYYYPDIMTLDSYIKSFYNTKSCTSHLPEGLVYNTATSCTMNFCNIHQEKYVFAHFTRVEQLSIIDFENSREGLD